MLDSKLEPLRPKAAADSLLLLAAELNKTHSVTLSGTEILHVQSGTVLIVARKVADDGFVLESLLGEHAFSDPRKLLEVAFRSIGLHQLCYSQEESTSKLDPDMCELLFYELSKAAGRTLKSGFDLANWSLSAFVE